MVSSLMEKNLNELRRDKSRFKATNYDKNGEIFCSKCGYKKLAKIKLPDTGFGRSLDPEGKGYFMAVCECKCGLSKKEIDRKQNSKMEYLWEHKKNDEISEEEFSSDDDLPFE